MASLSADEFRKAITDLGMTQVEAAAALEVDARTVRRWVLGERAVSGPVRVALRYMAQLRGSGDEAG
jgi:DNA-binding transcriptional regulator YiaG